MNIGAGDADEPYFVNNEGGQPRLSANASSDSRGVTPGVTPVVTAGVNASMEGKLINTGT